MGEFLDHVFFPKMPWELGATDPTWQTEKWFLSVWIIWHRFGRHIGPYKIWWLFKWIYSKFWLYTCLSGSPMWETILRTSSRLVLEADCEHTAPGIVIRVCYRQVALKTYPKNCFWQIFIESLTSSWSVSANRAVLHSCNCRTWWFFFLGQTDPSVWSMVKTAEAKLSACTFTFIFPRE